MSASPGGRGAAGERCPGLPCAHSLPTRGRQGQRPALRWAGAGLAAVPLPNTSRYPGGRRPGWGLGGARPALPPAGVTTRQLSPSIPAGLLCPLGAGARPVLSRGERWERSPAVAASSQGREGRRGHGSTEGLRRTKRGDRRGPPPSPPSPPRGAAAASPASRGGGRARRCPGPFPAVPLPVRKKASTSESGTAPSSAAPSAGFMAGGEAAASPAAGNIQ